MDYVYDDDGKLTSRIDTTGTTSFAYDHQGHVVSKALPAGRNACSSGGSAMTYTYDPVGNLKTHCTSAGTITYGYDAAHRLTGLAEPGGSCTGTVSKCTTFGYDNADRRTSTVFPTTTAVTQSVAYDGAGNLTEIRATRADSPVTELTDFDYTYTRAGSATVDRQLRHTMTNTANVTTTYGYDAFGNRSTKTVGALTCASGTVTTYTYTYNDADQLASATGQAATPAYDGNGSETTGPNGRTATLTTMDQTASISPSGGSAFTMTYADVASTERTAAGSSTFADSILGLDQELTGGGTTYTYVRDNLGNLVARLSSSGTRYYYLTDGLGSIIKLIDTAGAVTNEYAYDSWGNTTVVTAGVYNPWRYAAGYTDTTTGLTKFGTRYYDPALGRWTQRDPSGMEGNPYSYVSCDPVNRVDPTGLFGLDLCFVLNSMGGDSTAIRDV